MLKTIIYLALALWLAAIPVVLVWSLPTAEEQKQRTISDEETSAALTRDGRALTTFSNKIYLAHAMGLIDEITRADLNIIRNIRNIFAHAMGHVSFANPEIQQECNKLKTDAVYKKPYLGSDQSGKDIWRSGNI